MVLTNPFFERSEFACKCGCGCDTVDSELLTVLHALRSHFDTRCFIASGCRCIPYNRKVGGAVDSQHTKGRAADIVVENVPPATVQDYLEKNYPGEYGIGRYRTFTHIDTRTHGPARWSGEGG